MKDLEDAGRVTAYMAALVLSMIAFAWRYFAF